MKLPILWTERETKDMARLVAKKATKEELLAKFPAYSEEQVERKARQMGWYNPNPARPTNRQPTDWRENDVKSLKTKVINGASLDDLCYAFPKRKEHQIIAKLEEMKLRIKNLSGNSNMKTVKEMVYNALGSRVSERRGGYYLDGKPALLGYVIRAANEELKKQGLPLIGRA